MKSGSEKRAAWAIRRAGAFDAVGLARLHAVCFEGEERWEATAFARLMSMPGMCAFLAAPIGRASSRQRPNAAASQPNMESSPIGLAMLRLVAEEAEIISLCVLPDARRQGVGGQLLTTLVEAAAAAGAARLHLEVAADNTAALALYGTADFRWSGLRKGYYRRSDGALVDARILSRVIDRRDGP